MESSPTTDLVRLAEQAASLSTDLYTVQEKSQYETKAGEITSIADELSRLSTTLWHLHVAINADPEQYTDAFQEDLAEIIDELIAVFEEISECCTGLELADPTMSAVAWFFKKGRVGRLLKHLEALKGTCVVMRTVLWHGKSYGKHTSDRCAESSPHTMQEDRIILESVLAQNRDAILDLHRLTNMLSNDGDYLIERTPSKARNHHQNLSGSIGVEIPPIPDVLPPSSTEDKNKGKETAQSKLDRTFSKRGVRLGVHASILDLDAHEAPIGLKKKWLQEAHLRKQLSHDRLARGGLTALPELSRISEVDTNAGSNANLHHNQVQLTIPVIPESPDSPKQTPEVPVNTPMSGSMDETSLSSTTRKMRPGTMSTKLRKVFSRMSLNTIYSPPKADISTELGPSPVIRSETRVDAMDDSPIKRASLRRRLHQENRPRRRTLSEVLKDKFAKGSLTVDQFDDDYKHSRL